jgi:hypothetical protein
VELPGPDVENTDSNSNDDYSNVSAPVNQQESLSQRTRRPPREPDSPDRALSIVSELKANAALFAAFAYGGLSIPSLLTVTESKVTSVTTSISTARPLPGSDLVHTFVILDTVTLCLMISCVAASQLLIYRLTDGSWYDMEEQRNYREEEAFGNEEGREIEPQIKPPHTGLSSAMGRLVVDYGLEFSVARTTFDLGLVALLSAVAVRTLATFEASISLPIISLLGGTALLLGAAYLQSYIRVFRPLEKSQQRREVGRSTALANIMVPFFFLVAITAGVLSSSSVDGTFTTAATDGVPTQENTIAAKLVSYSSAAGKAKLKFVVDKIAEERAGPGKDSNSKKAFKPREKKSSSPKQDQSSRVVNEGKERMKQTQSTRRPIHRRAPRMTAPASQKGEKRLLLKQSVRKTFLQIIQGSC